MHILRKPLVHSLFYIRRFLFFCQGASDIQYKTYGCTLAAKCEGILFTPTTCHFQFPDEAKWCNLSHLPVLKFYHLWNFEVNGRFSHHKILCIHWFCRLLSSIFPALFSFTFFSCIIQCNSNNVSEMKKVKTYNYHSAIACNKMV